MIKDEGVLCLVGDGEDLGVKERDEDGGWGVWCEGGLVGVGGCWVGV